MRSPITKATVLLLAIIAVAVASPAAAAGVRNCKPIYAEIQTTWMDEKAIEIGWISGTFDGGVFLQYDNAVPVDPKVDPPNLVISTKTGNVNLWVYDKGGIYEEGTWYRRYVILQAKGTGSFARTTIAGSIYGLCVEGKGGTYEFEGLICEAPPFVPPKK